MKLVFESLLQCLSGKLHHCMSVMNLQENQVANRPKNIAYKAKRTYYYA